MQFSNQISATQFWVHGTLGRKLFLCRSLLYGRVRILGLPRADEGMKLPSMVDAVITFPIRTLPRPSFRHVRLSRISFGNSRIARRLPRDLRIKQGSRAATGIFLSNIASTRPHVFVVIGCGPLPNSPFDAAIFEFQVLGGSKFGHALQDGLVGFIPNSNRVSKTRTLEV